VIEISEALIIKSRQAWLDQAKTASKAWQEAGSKNLREFAKDNYEQFCKLIEAYIALNVKVGKEMRDLAKIVPVKDALGLP